MTNRMKATTYILGAVMILALVVAMAFAIASTNAPTAAAASNISYIDENGTTRTASANQITKHSNANTFTSGWYYASGEVEMNIDYDFNISGDVKIILVNGAKLHQYNPVHISAGSTLTIYGQTTGDNMGYMRVTDPYNTTVDGEGTLVVKSGWLDVKRTASGSPAVTCSTQFYGGKSTIYGLTSTAITGNVTLGNNMVVKAGDSSGSVSLVENYATNHGHRYAIISRKVNVSGLSFSNSSVNVNAGGDVLRYLPTVAPSNASYNELRYITWSSSNTSVATVNENGYVQPIGVGTTTITATASNGTASTSDDKKATYTVKVVTPTPVSYLKYNEVTGKFTTAQCKAYQPLTNQWTWGTEGYTRWYVVESNQSLSKPMYTGSNLEPLINVIGDVRLIIKDGVRLAIDTHGIKIKSGASLTIYAQSTGSQMGELYSNGTTGEGTYPGWNPGNPGIDADSATLTINGCKVTGQAGRNDIGISCQHGGKLIINAGEVSGYARMGNIHAGLGDPECIGGINSTIVINGGKVYADIPNDDWGYAIGCAPRWGWSSITINGGEVTSYSYHGSAFGGSVKLGEGVFIKTGEKSGNVEVVNGYNGTKYAYITGDPILADKVTISQTSLTMVAGDKTEQLSAFMSPSNAFFNYPRFLVWSTSDESIATIDQNGLIYPVAPGQVTITATATNTPNDSSDDVVAICTVTVNKPEPIRYRDFTKNGDYIDDKYCTEYTNILAGRTEWGKIGQTTWYVIKNDLTLGRIIVHGDVRLIVMNGATFTVSGVTNRAGGKLTIYSQSDVETTMGKLINNNAFEGNVVFNGGNVKVSGAWCAVTGVATFNDGYIEMNTSVVSNVEAKISSHLAAHSGDELILNLEANFNKPNVKISPRILATSITLDNASLNMTAGADPYTIKVIFSPSTATFNDNRFVDFESSDEAVALVDANGVVHPLAPGTTVITATATNYTDDASDDVSATMTINVSAPSPVTYNVGADTCDAYETVTTDKTVFGSKGFTRWYVVSGNVTVNDRINVIGNVNLILMDGATLTTNGGVGVAKGNTLNVYSQSFDTETMGKLIAIGSEEAGIGNGGNINFYGGTIWASENGAIVGNIRLASGLVYMVGEDESSVVLTAVNGNYKYASCAYVGKPIVLTQMEIAAPEELKVRGSYATLTPVFTPSNATYRGLSYLKWSSADTSIATVDGNGRVYPVAPGKVTITVVANNNTEDTSDDVTATCEVTVGIVEVTEITLNQTAAELRVNVDTLNLKATIAPANASYLSVVWSSSEDGIATVDQNGKVTPVKAGNVTITATAVGGKSATCQIAVVFSHTEVTLDKSEITLSANGANGNLYHTLTNQYASDRSVVWTSSDPSVATVDQSGVVTPIWQGTTMITVTALNGTPDDDSDDEIAECTVTVNAVSVTQVVMSKTSITLFEKDIARRFTANVLPENASYKDITWSTSDPTVASVDENGRIAPLMVGTATITATATNNPGDPSDDVSATCFVTVVARDPLYYAAYDSSAKTFIEGMCYTYALVSDFTQQWTESDETGNWYVADGDITLDERVVVSGNVNLIILAGVTVNATKGINVPSGASLTIYTQTLDEKTMGVLNATGIDRTAGIGGNDSQAAGNITIHGGVINAKGGKYAAGIGGGQAGAGGTTIIYGGVITADGGGRDQWTAGYAAGIGGGANAGEWYGSAGGTIVINGGRVTARGNTAGDDGRPGRARAIGGGGEFYYDSSENYSLTLGRCMTIANSDSHRWQEAMSLTIESDHHYGDLFVAPPSHTKDGYSKRTCSVCGEVETVYYHKFACTEHQLTKIEEKDATCAAPGNAYTYWHCDVCGYNFADAEGLHFIVETEEYAALPHTLPAAEEWVVTKAATCTEDGRKAILCTVCGGEVKTQVIPAIGHDWTPWHPSDEEGKETRTCLTCGDIQTRDDVNSEVYSKDNNYQGELATVAFNGANLSDGEITLYQNNSFTVTASIRMIDRIVLHVASINNYSDRVRASSGTVALSDDGWVVTVSDVNAAFVTISLSQYFIHFDQFEVFYKGYQERYKAVEKVDATCTEAGNIKYWIDTYTCRYYSDENAENEIELADTVIPALGHDLVHHDKQAATCTENGWKAYDTCSRCDYTTYSEIAALGHVAGTWTVKTQPSCTEKGEETSACSVCGETLSREIDALGHSWDKWVEDVPEVGKETHTCKVCAASETRDMVSVTEFSLRSAETQTEGDYAVAYCPGGGWSGESTCVSDGGITITAKDGRYIKKVAFHVHDLQQWADDTFADKGELTLSDGGWTIIVDNIYSNSVKLDCEGPLMISYADIYFVGLDYYQLDFIRKVDAIDATCTEAGNIEYWHDIYNDLYYSDENRTTEIGKADVVIPAKGHTVSEWIITLEPTCTEVGSQHKVCTVCGKELETEELAALGHNMVYVEAEEPTTCAGGHEAGEICSRCGYTTAVKIPVADPDMYPHTWGRWIDSETESETEYRVCRICGATESRKIPMVSEEINPDRWANWTYNYNGRYSVVEFKGGDSPTLYSGWDANVKVTAKNGKSILKVIFTIYDGEDPNTAYADKGVVTVEDGKIVVSNINANTFTLNSNEMVNVQSVRIYVSQLVKGVTKYDYVAATCTADGHIAYWYDAYNDLYFADEACKNEITLADTVLAKLGHDIQQYEAKAATCTEIGWRAHEACTRCDYTTRHEIAVLGHLASKVVNTVAPTCTERGYTVFYCERCGENYEARYVSALGHSSSDWVVVKEPTCTEMGSKHKVCTVCGEELEVEEIEKIDHVKGEWTISAAPTCTNKGRKIIVCTVCGTRLQSEEIEPHGHIYVKWETTLEPTCTEKGSKHRVCVECENEEVEEIEALGHSWNKWTRQNKQDTRSCTVCGASETRNVPISEETISINSAIPNYSGKFADIYCGEPGYNENGAYPSGGIKVTTKEKVVIVKAVFNVGWGEYYAHSAYADKGQVYVEDDGERIVVDNIYSDSVELRQNPSSSPAIIQSVTIYYLTSSKVDKVEAVAATCMEDGNIEYYYDWYYGMYFRFDDCENVISRKDTFIPALGHKLVEVVQQPTCTRKGYKHLVCTICGEEFKVEEIAALGHDMVHSEPRAATCAEVGLETACEVCSRCGYSMEATIAKLPHTPAEQWEVTLAPTCIAKGSKHLLCSVCGEELDVETIAALGHNPGEWKYIVEPTCTGKGIRHSLCTECGIELKIEKVPATGHRWGKWIASTTQEGKESHTCTVCGEVVTRNVPSRVATPSMSEAYLSGNDSLTISGKDGSYIERVILTIGWYPEYAADLRVERGDITISNDGNTIDIKNIYLKSVRIWTSNHAISITSITYYYPAMDTDPMKIEAVAPTCTVDGNIEYWLDIYDDLYFAEEECENIILKENVVVPATGHSFGDWEFTIEPTCTEKGRKRRVCANCQQAEYLDVPALGHKMVYTEAREATCQQVGLTTDGEICSRCGYTTIETIPFADHTWSRWIDSETEEGKEVHTCRICGTSESRDIVSGSDTIVTNTSQNNYSGQYTDIYVPVAGDGDGARADRDDGGIYITAKDGRLIEKIVCSVGFGEDHSNGAYVNKGNVIVTNEGYTITVENIYSNYVAFRAQEYLQISSITVYFVQFSTLIKTEATDPTCTEDGNVEYWFDAYSNMYFLDEACENQIDDLAATVLPALGHSAANEWVVTKESTCTEHGRISLLCTVCGVELEGEDIALLPHAEADEWTVTKAPTCTEKGRRALLCTVCGNELDGADIDALGHDLIHHDRQAPTCTEFGCEAYDTCSRCDYTTYQRIAKLPHTPATEWTETVAPTCTKKGVKAILCTVCGAALQTKNTSPTGHDIVYVDAKEPTCTEAGWEAYEHCSHEGCTYSTKVEIPALGHAKGEFIEKVDPTCTEEGYSVYHCSRCEATLQDDFVPALGHTPGGAWIVVTEPTCTEEGVQHRLCTVCGEEAEVGTIPALGHLPGEWEVAVPATCTEKGTKHKVCSICGEETETEEIDALGHTPGEWDITREATCLEKGSRVRYCTVCGELSDSEEIEALGHDWSEWEVTLPATCTEKGSRHKVCSRCDEEEVEELDATGHNFGDWIVTELPTCTEKGSKHNVCSGCGEEIVEEIDAIGHTASEWQIAKEPTCIETGSKHRVCTVCKEEVEVEELPMVAHTESDEWEITLAPTCTEKGSKHLLCSVCGEELDVLDVPELGHTWGEWTVDKAATETEEGREERECAVCHEVETRIIPMVGHTHTIVFVEAKDATCEEGGNIAHYKCSVCERLFIDENGEIAINPEDVPSAALGHDFIEEVTDSTCKEHGHVKITCSRCDYEAIEELPFAEHTYGDWVVTKEPQIGVRGEETRTCTVCGATDTRDVASLPYIPVVAEDGTIVYKEEVTEEGKDVTDLFKQANEQGIAVEVNAGDLVIVFDEDAVTAIGEDEDAVTISAKVSTENLTVEGAELVIEVTVSGATFENGTAKVTIPFNKVVPIDKVVKVYYIAPGGERTDMEATFENGMVTFYTNHFSTYAVFLEIGHNHDFTYSVDGATITATCANTDGLCYLDDYKATLTIAAPTLTVYGGEGSAEATVTNNIEGIDTPAIVYKKGDAVLDAAPTDAGTYTANVTLGGATASVEYTIAKKAASVTAIDKSKTYGDADPALTATVDGTVGDDTISYTLSRAEGTNVGEYVITVALGENPNYDVATTNAKLTIAKKAASVTAIDKSKTYGEVDPELTATALGTVGTDVINYTLSRAEGENVSEYAITVTLGDNPNYEVTATGAYFTINKKAASVTANDKSKTYGEANPNLTATVGGTVGDDTISYTLSRAEGENVGDYAITVTLGNNPNYEVTATDGKFTITKKAASVTAIDKSKTYGEVDPELTATVNGTIGNDTINYTLSRAEGTNIGEYVITVALGENPNYEVATTNAKLIINKKAASVTAIDKSKTYGEVDPELTATALGTIGTDVINYTLSRAEGTNVGEYVITVALGENPNYEVATTNAKLTIAKKAASVTPADKSKAYGEDDPELTATALGLVGEDALNYTLSRTVGENVGEYVISVTLGNNPNYDVTITGTATYTINKKAVTLNLYVDGVIVTEATSISYDGQEHTFVVKAIGANDEVITIVAETQTNVFSSTEFIVYAQNLTADGSEYENYVLDSDYNVPDYAIAAKAITITADDKSSVYGESIVGLTAQITDGNGVYVLPDEDSEVFVLTKEQGVNAGEYVITVNVVGNSNYIVTPVNGIYAINQKAVTVTPDDKAITYGDDNVALTYATVGLVEGETLTGIALTRTEGNNVGTYTITTTHDDTLDGNYIVTISGTATYTINQKAVTVTPEDKAITYGDDDVALTYVVTGLVGEDALTGITLTREEGANADTYAITATHDDSLDLNYAVTITGTAVYTIQKKANTINTDGIVKEYTYNGSNFTVEGATALGDGAISYENNVLKEAGSYTVIVKVAEGTNYLAAETTVVITVKETAPITNEETGTSTHSKIISVENAQEGASMTEIFKNAQADESESKEISATIDAANIVFNEAAIEEISTADEVELKFNVVYVEDPEDIETAALQGAEVIIKVSLSEGITFASGKATITIDLKKEVPDKKIVKVYYVDADGSRTDMNATFADGKVTFETNHFSDYIVVFEKKGLSGGAIAGIVIACVVVLIGAVLLVLWLLKKKGNGKNDDGESLIHQDEAVADDNAIAENDTIPVETENAPASEQQATETIATEDDAEDGGVVVDAKGNYFNIRYNRSFMAKLIQSPETTQGYYTALKNEVLAYSKTKSRVSWAYDSVNAGRSAVVKFGIRGKTLCVYFALNADDYADSKYKVEKVESAKYEAVPCMYRIKNDRRLGYAKDLIAAVCAKLGLTKGDVPTEDYRLPYETTEALVAKELIKELTVAATTTQIERAKHEGTIRIVESVSAGEVNDLISNEVAASVIVTERRTARTGKRGTINVDVLSANFESGETVTIERLHEKKLIPASVGQVKLLARGKLDKVLHVELQDYSIEAVKMVIATGGTVKRV